MSEPEVKEVSILKRQNSDLQKEVEDLKNEIKRLKKEKQSTDIIKCMEQIQDDLRPRYVRLDELIHNPGLEHIATHIFKYLDPKSLGQCRAVSTGWKFFIDNDKYWWIQVLEAKKVLKRGWRPNCEAYKQHEFYKEFEATVAYIKENESLENLRLLGRFILDYYCCFDKLEEPVSSGWNKMIEEIYLKTSKNHKPGDPESPLHFAADNNRLDILNYLASLPTICDMNLEIVIDPYSPKGTYPFFARKTILGNACQKNQVEIVEFFMKLRGNKKIDFNECSNSYTLFHEACASGNIEVVKLFLKHAKKLRIDLNARNLELLGPPSARKTPFKIAVKRSKKDVVKLLLSDNRIDVSNVNEYDNSVLFQSLKIIKKNNTDCKMALFYHDKKQDEIFTMLVNSPRIPLEGRYNGETIFHAVFEMKDANKAEVLLKEAIKRNIVSYLSARKNLSSTLTQNSLMGLTAIHCAFKYDFADG